jgi:hypothetical protein
MATSAVAYEPIPAAAHAPSPLVLWSIALAGLALAAVELALAIPRDGSDIEIALLLWITVPYIAAGLIAWWRRPDSRLGKLMIAGGFAIGLSSLQMAENQWLTTLGALFDILPAAIFLTSTWRSRTDACGRGSSEGSCSRRTPSPSGCSS